MNPNYKRTPQDIANEYAAVWQTVRARQSRMPATQEGLAFSERMEAIGKTVEVCLTEPGVLVATAEGLAVAEQALISARSDLADTTNEFLALDTASQTTTRVSTPQVASVDGALRTPTAMPAR